MNKIKVGYLGPGTNTFGYQALDKFFAAQGLRSIEAVPLGSHHEVCLAVGNMDVEYGVVAVENVVDGVVAETVRSVESIDSHLGLKIWGEVALSIELFYMSKSGDRSLVKTLHSHSTAIGQCHTFIAQLQQQGIRIEVQPSTARGAEIAKTDPEAAALASRAALKNFGLKLIRKDSVTDHQNSATRFWVLGKKHSRLEEVGDRRATKRFKSCFLANLEQTASGVLHKTLGVFAEKGISVLIMYPSPILGKKWEYTFLVEVGGHVSEPRMIEAWDDFRKLGISLSPLRFLGCYPDATSDN